MINIRGLAFDDPRSTQGIKFSTRLDTLKFVAQDTEDDGQLEV